MTASDVLALLMETTLASSAALLLVMLIRRPVRQAFGAGSAYALWALVPAAMVAVVLPAAVDPVAPALVLAAPTLGLVAPMNVGDASGPGNAAWLFWTWSLGSLAMVAVMTWRQWRYRVHLGPLYRRPDGYYQSLATRGLPAVLGFTPRIVLPGDFDQRYSAIERELVLAHENEHLRRGDLKACALALALRVVFWFNPLLHMAAARFRQDQELACDAGVLRRFPHCRRHYGAAMLKTELAEQALPLGCHWFGSHPLKERFAMLTSPSISIRRRVGGLFFVALLALATTALAWAAQPGPQRDVPAGKLLLELDIKVDGVAVNSARTVVSPGIAHEERFDHEGQDWRTQWTVVPGADGSFDLSAVLRRDGELVASPRLLLEDRAAIGVGDKDAAGHFKGIEVELRVSAGPPAAGMAAEGIQGDVPNYPSNSADAGEGGVVMLKLLVGADGLVQEMQFVPEKSTLPEGSALVRSTMQAAAKWRLDPQLKDGKPVAGWVMVPVQFDPTSATPDS